MDFTNEQLQAIDCGQAVPINVAGRSCVLIPGKLYEQLSEDWHPAVMQRQFAKMMADDWADPAMDIYDE
jgi:hypothetical protein